MIFILFRLFMMIFVSLKKIRLSACVKSQFHLIIPNRFGSVTYTIQPKSTIFHQSQEMDKADIQIIAICNKIFELIWPNLARKIVPWFDTSPSKVSGSAVDHFQPSYVQIFPEECTFAHIRTVTYDEFFGTSLKLSISCFLYG